MTRRATEAGKLLNLSVRAFAGDGDDQLIAGMSMAGTVRPHRVLVRAAGPALRQFFVTDFCRDPSLVVRSANGGLVAQNRDWEEYGDQPTLRSLTSAVGAFPFAPGGADAALVAALENGTYSTLAADGGGGTALIECYDADWEQLGGFVNLSVRAEMKSSPLIVGIVVHGAPARLLVRAVGPSLAQFGVGGAAANPALRIHSGTLGGDIATNEDWSTIAQRDELGAVAGSVGAFRLEEGSKDAALIALLPPGVYSATVDATVSGGVALVEVYRLTN